MPPTGGEGGNNAIRDAALLVQRLKKIATTEDREGILGAEIQEYEKEMLRFSWSSVSKSYRYSTFITAEGYIFPYILRAMFRFINFFIGVKTGT